MSHPTASQLGELSTYDREAIIAVVADFYQFLAKLPYIESADILYPPEGGWPNITQENFACLGKNEEVIELLKLLPYIRMDGSHEYLVAPETSPCDYRRDYFQSPSFAEGRGPWDVPVGFEFPPWVIPLTYGKNHGDYLMLDTTDGEFYHKMNIYHMRPDFVTNSLRCFPSNPVVKAGVGMFSQVSRAFVIEKACLSFIVCKFG